MAGLDVSLVTPCGTEDFATKAKRPQYSVLGSERTEVFGIEPLPPWSVSLPNVIRELTG